MSNDKKSILIILILVVVGVAGFLAYYFFFKPAPGAGLAESGIVAEPSQFDTFGGNNSLEGSSTVNLSGDLLLILSQLQSITLENKLENHPGFSGLEDQTVRIEPREAGRENPFAPFVGKPAFSSGE